MSELPPQPWPQQPSAQPPPAPPPLMAVAPVPVLPVEYTFGQPRPGVITVIGIVSIVLASLGLLTGLVGGLYAVGFTIASAVSSSVATMPPTSAPSATVTAIGGSDAQDSADELDAGPRGLAPPARLVIAAGLARKHPFDDEKKNRLHELLAKGGQEIFPAATNGSPSVAAIVNDVTESAELPSADGSAEGPIYFIVGTGKIELYDDHAVFFPTSHGQPVRIAKGVSIDEDDVEAAAVSGGSTKGTLTPTQVQAVVNQAQSLSGNRMNLVQLERLTKELQNPNQPYIDARRGSPPPVRQVQTVNMQFDSSAQVFMSHGFVVISPSGQTTSSSTMNPAAAFSRFRIRPSASVLTIITSALGLALAIYLLVVGILTMRQRPSTRRLHLIYAALKIPLAVLAAVGWFLFIDDLTRSMTAVASMGPGASSPPLVGASSAGAMAIAIMLGLAACAYPVALLILMNMRNVREYYRVATAPR
jgi:hypothetical protein